MLKKRSRVVLPNDPAYIDGVVAYCSELARKAGFDQKEAGELSRALREASENVVTHAFNPHEEESFTVKFDIFSNGIKITIDEMGLPFSPLSIEGTEEEERAPGLKAIKENVDKVVYINRGREGKELQLYKYLKAVHVDSLLSADELTPYDSCPLPPKDMEYTVRRMEPGEEIEVSRCIYRSYRYTYLNEDLYFPRRIEAMNRDGRMISFVAAAGDGEIVGHFALEPRPNGKSSEIGVAVVAPSHRKRGLMRMLLNALIEEAKRLGIKNLFGNAFTMHTQSQKTNLKFGFHETALQLACIPAASVQCMLEKKLKGAGNVISCYLYLSPAKKYTVYLPQRHREILREIYANIGIERNFEDTGMALSPDLPEESELKLLLKPSHRTAAIEVLRQGKDLEARVRSKMAELQDKGFNSVYVDFELRDPATPASVAVLENAGLFFSGLFPDFSEGDVLRLQRYFTVVSYDEVETESEFAKRIKEYVMEADPRRKVMQR